MTPMNDVLLLQIRSMIADKELALALATREMQRFGDKEADYLVQYHKIAGDLKLLFTRLESGLGNG